MLHVANEILDRGSPFKKKNDSHVDKKRELILIYT
jgi:hypothetical protein